MTVRVHSVKDTAARGTAKRSHRTRVDEMCSFLSESVETRSFYRGMVEIKLMILHNEDNVFHYIMLLIKSESPPVKSLT